MQWPFLQFDFSEPNELMRKSDFVIFIPKSIFPGDNDIVIHSFVWKMSSTGRPSFSELMQPRFSIHVPENIQVRLPRNKNFNNPQLNKIKQNQSIYFGDSSEPKQCLQFQFIPMTTITNFFDRKSIFGMVLISRFNNIMHPVTVLSLRTGSI